MSTKLKVNGATGKAAIYSGSDGVFVDPSLDPSRVAFHSDLPYMGVVYDQTVTVALARPSGAHTSNYNIKHYFPDHNLGIVPFGVFLLDGEMIVGSDYRQINNWYSQSSYHFFRRQIVPGFGANRVWFRDQSYWSGTANNTAPARTVTVRAILFAPDLEETMPHTAALISPDRVAFGNGKFDTDKDYIRNVDIPNPLFRYLGPQTVDGNHGTMRMLLSNGGVRDFRNFNSQGYTSNDEAVVPTIGPGFDL